MHDNATWVGRVPSHQRWQVPSAVLVFVLTRSCSTWTSSSSWSSSCSPTPLRNATWFPLPFCTRRSLTTLALRRSCPRLRSPLVRASLVPSSWPAACAFVALRLYSTVGFPNAVLLHSCLNGGQVGTQITNSQNTLVLHERWDVQRPCSDVGFILIREFVP